MVLFLTGGMIFACRKRGKDKLNVLQEKSEKMIFACRKRGKDKEASGLWIRF